MRTIKLHNKEYKLRATVGSIRRIMIKYDIKDITTWPQEKHLQYTLEILWQFIQPRLFFKPWVFFKRFENKVDAEDVRKSVSVLFGMLYGIEIPEKSEDKESGNVTNPTGIAS